MSLDLRQVLPQVETLGQEAARRAADAAARLPQLERSLRETAQLDPDELRRRLAAAPPTAQPAGPTDEKPDAAFELPPHPERLRLVAADGSQVYPNRHDAAFFYVINIGSFSVVRGGHAPPQAATRSELHFADEDVHDSRGLPVDTHLVNARRDVAELKELARLAGQPSPEATVALLDNGLLLWAASQEQKAVRPDVQRVLEEYLHALDDLRDSGAALAGYISRPRGAHVLDLAGAVGGWDETSRLVLSDRLLFGRMLPPYARSARFRHPSRLNDEFTARGHEIQFSYLHTGAQDGIARVELPRWVAEDPRRMSVVHAAVIEQCRVTGIPYPLVRAHELALVGQDDRRALEELVTAALARHGASGLASQKAQTKRWTSRRRRHRL
jgi:hypothetical protein